MTSNQFGVRTGLRGLRIWYVLLIFAAAASLPVDAGPYLPAIQKGTIAIHLKPIATQMGAPDYAISPPGDTNRLFVVEQNGLLRIIANGTLQPGSALNLQGRVSPPFNPGSAN